MLNIGVKKAIYTCCPDILHPVLNRVEASEIGYRLARGAFWSMAGAVISRGLMLAASVLVARMLGKTGYGELGMIQSTVGMFGVFAGFGLGLTATKHVAEFFRSDPERAGRIIGLSGLVALATGGLMALGLVIFAPWLAEHTINAPHLAGVLRIGAVILFISALNGAQTGALSGFEAFKTIAYINLFVGLSSFPIIVGGAYFGGLTGAVWALAINLGFNWLFNHLALRKEAHRYRVPFTFRKCSRELSILWRFSLPAVLSGAMVGPVTWACNALLVNQPDGYSKMGIFTAALVFQNLLFFASGMLNAPLLSMVSNAGTNVSEKLGTVNILSSWILGVVFAIPLLCFPEITQMLFGADYDTRSFTVTFSIVVFYTCVLTFRSGLARVLAARNLLWWGLCSNLLWTVILLSTVFFLVDLGAVGLAASYAIAHVLISVIVVTFYVSQGLAPKGTLISKESLLVWLIITGLTVSSFWEFPVIMRLIFMLLALFLTGWSFIRIWQTAHLGISGGYDV
ncbi:MAG: oligosaccharide flippase family protein [Candidatus Berkelbacteria bacterium]|nr:oligosaccharide flippase family protein [Candidatus Berkelbacteria bacterium]